MRMAALKWTATMLSTIREMTPRMLNATEARCSSQMLKRIGASYCFLRVCQWNPSEDGSLGRWYAIKLAITLVQEECNTQRPSITTVKHVLALCLEDQQRSLSFLVLATDTFAGDLSSSLTWRSSSPPSIRTMNATATSTLQLCEIEQQSTKDCVH